MKYSFKNDYSETCHESILEAFKKLGNHQFNSYGNDSITEEAIEKIKSEINNDKVSIHFVVGGTLANKSSLSHILRPYEGIIATDFSHIATHETGAIENTGHRIVEVPHENGKLNTSQIQSVYDWHNSEHSIKPKIVYISNTTELGSVYTYEEIKKIYDLCKDLGMYLYIDGARLGNALANHEAGLDLSKISSICDVFTIGGAKNGAMLGEAIVVVNEELQPYFRYNLKQKGAIVSKGWIVATQFKELFQNNLYLELASNSNRMGQKISDIFENLGFELFSKTESNQVFPILPNSILSEISSSYGYEFWEKYSDTHSVVRFVSSWSTPEKIVDEFGEYLKTLL